MTYEEWELWQLANSQMEHVPKSLMPSTGQFEGTIELPEAITGMISQEDGVLVFGDAGGLWLIDEHGHTNRVKDDPQPDHIIVKE